jgi:hypothetical protein
MAEKTYPPTRGELLELARKFVRLNVTQDQRALDLQREFEALLKRCPEAR